MGLTLLKEEQLWGKHALKIMQDGAMLQVPLSDAAVLLGGWLSRCLRGVDGKVRPLGDLWSASANISGYVCCVIRHGDKGLCQPDMRHVAVRPALSPSETSNIRSSAARAGGFRSAKTYLYGEYPQTIAQNQDELEHLYQQNRLAKTGKSYSFDSAGIDDFDTPYQKRVCSEYSYQGAKYIRIEAKVSEVSGDSNSVLSNGVKPQEGKAYWVKVEPVEWVEDKSGWWVCKQAIAAGMQFDRCTKYYGNFEKTDMYQRLQEIGQQMQPSRVEVHQEEKVIPSSEKPQTDVYENEIKSKIARNKERLKKEPKLKGVFGGEVARIIAEAIRNGVIQETITPEVGKKLSASIQRKLAEKKKQNS